MAKAKDGARNVYRYESIEAKRVTTEYIAPGVRAAEAWDKFAAQAGWGDDPGGLFTMILREMSRFWLSVT